MSAYYNERDPFAAQWLRNLIAAGHIAPGEVDERSITEVSADDLREFRQCHFFAGIGVWSHALRRAGWADDAPVWTGSCPCQPFSSAGKQDGFADERHLWPTWFRLIAERRPAIVLGEQVASALDWLDLVSADMEGADYAFGSSDLCAAGFGGAHIRARLYFSGVADAAWGNQLGHIRDTRGEAGAGGGEAWAPHGHANRSASGHGGMADAHGEGRSLGCERDGGASAGGEVQQRPHDDRCGSDARADAPLLGRNTADWLFCRDAKWRPVEPGTFPLADEAPARVGRLRAYGNALDAETAAQFAGAVREALADMAAPLSMNAAA